jgi:hypothetical protein
MNYYYDLPIDIKKSIVYFVFCKELNEKIKKNFDNNIENLKSGKLKLCFYTSGISQFHDNHVKNLISDMEKGYTELFWKTILYKLEILIMKKNFIFGLSYKNKDELLDIIYTNKITSKILKNEEITWFLERDELTHIILKGS